MRIKEIRLQNGISQKQLALAIGVAQNTLSQYENGKRAPDFDTMARISDYFHVSVDYLLGRDEEKPLAQSEELSAIQKEAVQFIKKLSDDQLVRFISMGQAALEMGGGQQIQNTPRREAEG